MNGDFNGAHGVANGQLCPLRDVKLWSPSVRVKGDELAKALRDTLAAA